MIVIHFSQNFVKITGKNALVQILYFGNKCLLTSPLKFPVKDQRSVNRTFPCSSFSPYSHPFLLLENFFSLLQLFIYSLISIKTWTGLLLVAVILSKTTIHNRPDKWLSDGRFYYKSDSILKTNMIAFSRCMGSVVSIFYCCLITSTIRIKTKHKI